MCQVGPRIGGGELGASGLSVWLADVDWRRVRGESADYAGHRLRPGECHGVFEIRPPTCRIDHGHLAGYAKWRGIRCQSADRVGSDQGDAGKDGGPARADGRLFALGQVSVRVPRRDAEELPRNDGKSRLRHDDGQGRNDGHGTGNAWPYDVESACELEPSEVTSCAPLSRARARPGQRSLKMGAARSANRS